MAFTRKTPTLCERDTRQLWWTNLIHPLARDVKDTLLTRKRQLSADFDSNCVAAMSLCMIVLIVTRKRGDGRYYFALWQTNNNTPNKMLLSESAVSCFLRFTCKECVLYILRKDGTWSELTWFETAVLMDNLKWHDCEFGINKITNGFL
jgi:hypothetical protein